MNFSVKRELKRRHNYLIPFLFIFCARCIYKSSYTPPSHPPKNIPLQGEPHRFANNLRKSDRIGQKNLCSSVNWKSAAEGKAKSVGPFQIPGRPGRKEICVHLRNLRDPLNSPAAQAAKKSVWICEICGTRVSAERKSLLIFLISQK